MSRFSSVGDPFRRLGNDGLETQSNLTKDNHAFGSLNNPNLLGCNINRQSSVFSDQMKANKNLKESGIGYPSEYNVVLARNQSEAQIFEN